MSCKANLTAKSPALPDYLLVKLDILYESLQLSEVMKARTIFAAKSMFEMERQHVKRKTVAQCHAMFWSLLIHWIEILHRLMLKQA